MTINPVVGYDGTRLQADLDRDTYAFIDSDALATGRARLDALVIANPSAREATSAALGAAEMVAREVAALAMAHDLRIKTIGNGIVATLVEELVGSGGRTEGLAVTSSDPAMIRRALEIAPDLGFVIVAASFCEPVGLDVYGDIHRRGLTVRGVKPFARREACVGPVRPDLEPLQVSVGEVFNPGALWYRLASRHPAR